MGTQQPTAQRLRASLELQWRSDAIGQAGIDRVELQEQRAAVSIAYAPTTWLMLSATAPVLMRQIQEANLARDSVAGFGDAEFRAKLFVYRDRTLMPDHLLAVVGGLKVPTAALDYQANGRSLAPELQAGTGSFDPLAGIAYAYFGGDLSVFISEVIYMPLAGRADFRIGTSLRGTHTVQYQFFDFLAARLSANTRLEAATWLENPRRKEPDSGGFIGYVAPGLIISPGMDWVVYLEAQVPVLNALVGHHEEGLIASLGVAYDF